MKLLLPVCLVICSLAQCNNSIDPNREHELKAGNSNVEEGSIVLAKDSAIRAENIFSLSDAESILGEPAELKESLKEVNGGVTAYKCAYIAKSKDVQSGKTGIVYFMYEVYSQPDSAAKVYYTIKKSNESHEGVKVLKGWGDEAYYHSSENFYFILVRKAEKMFRMKVNKVTSKSSAQAFDQVTRKITDFMNS